MIDFAFGMFVGAFVAWIVWEEWAFAWTLKHRLRADLFTLGRDDVLEELAFVSRNIARRSAEADKQG